MVERLCIGVEATSLLEVAFVFGCGEHAQDNIILLTDLYVLVNVVLTRA
jgi:hypothetical protein